MTLKLKAKALNNPLTGKALNNPSTTFCLLNSFFQRTMELFGEKIHFLALSPTLHLYQTTTPDVCLWYLGVSRQKVKKKHTRKQIYKFASNFVVATITLW